jgi:radical SAM superfamily enzyme YgiQ (UPF0313 family)
MRMKVLLVYPHFPDSFWSFKHALSFVGKRAAQPPLGLMTIAALLPSNWEKRLVDTNVERLTDRQLDWADVVFLSGMQVQSEHLLDLVARCRARGLRTVVGGPITSSLSARVIGADHIVIGEAEELIAPLARDLEAGTALAVYQATERPAMELSPLPDYSLIRKNRYSTMTVQFSRGCPFNCEFCDIIEIYGRKPRTKAVSQVLAELNQLYDAKWRGPVFIVDDNLIGNKIRAKLLLAALVEWNNAHGRCFHFITEASLNLADDPELMSLMQAAGFVSVFLGIETPDESSLTAVGKLQNTHRSLLASVATIQGYNIEVMGGFILGFDTDCEGAFENMVNFIQQSAIPVSMVGLLQAMPGTQLFRRLKSEGRILSAGSGNNTAIGLNFLPRMDSERLIAGYRAVLERIYAAEPYYERVRLFLSRCQPRQYRGFNYASVRAFALSVVRMGVFSRDRWSYWRFLLEAATRYRKNFAVAMTLAVMGHHFRIMTQQMQESA